MKFEKKFNLNNERLFFMSDLHYGHENILNFYKDTRPFDSIKEHNEYLTRTIEVMTNPGDWIVDLGDLFWKVPSEEAKEFLEKFKDRHFIKILGNHDSEDLFRTSLLGLVEGGTVYDILGLKVKYAGEEVLVMASHYPILSWNSKAHGSIHTFGHCHGNLDSFVNSRSDLMVDVGVDGELAGKVGSFLIPFEEIYEHFRKKTGGMSFRSWARDRCTEI